MPNPIDLSRHVPQTGQVAAQRSMAPAQASAAAGRAYGRAGMQVANSLLGIAQIKQKRDADEQDRLLAETIQGASIYTANRRLDFQKDMAEATTLEQIEAAERDYLADYEEWSQDTSERGVPHLRGDKARQIYQNRLKPQYQLELRAQAEARRQAILQADRDAQHDGALQASRRTAVSNPAQALDLAANAYELRVAQGYMTREQADAALEAEKVAILQYGMTYHLTEAARPDLSHRQRVEHIAQAGSYILEDEDSPLLPDQRQAMHQQITDTILILEDQEEQQALKAMNKQADGYQTAMAKGEHASALQQFDAFARQHRDRLEPEWIETTRASIIAGKEAVHSARTENDLNQLLVDISNNSADPSQLRRYWLEHQSKLSPAKRRQWAKEIDRAADPDNPSAEIYASIQPFVPGLRFDAEGKHLTPELDRRIEQGLLQAFPEDYDEDDLKDPAKRLEINRWRLNTIQKFRQEQEGTAQRANNIAQLIRNTFQGAVKDGKTWSDARKLAQAAAWEHLGMREQVLMDYESQTIDDPDTYVEDQLKRWKATPIPPVEGADAPTTKPPGLGRVLNPGPDNDRRRPAPKAIAREPMPGSGPTDFTDPNSLYQDFMRGTR